jgi:hypothetical protein
MVGPGVMVADINGDGKPDRQNVIFQGLIQGQEIAAGDFNGDGATIS